MSHDVHIIETWTSRDSVTIVSTILVIFLPGVCTKWITKILGSVQYKFITVVENNSVVNDEGDG